MTCRFQDTDRAARLHLIASGLLLMLHDTEQASRFAEAGMQFQPSDKTLLARLKQAAALASQVHPAGTGFVVSHEVSAGTQIQPVGAN
jgi:hypothetical protein